MKFNHSIVLVSILALGAVGSAQDVASDVDKAAKDTGRVTEKAAKETGRGVKDGVKGVDKGTKDTGRATGEDWARHQKGCRRRRSRSEGRNQENR